MAYGNQDERNKSTKAALDMGFKPSADGTKLIKGSTSLGWSSSGGTLKDNKGNSWDSHSRFAESKKENKKK